jgi:hypothetical protein
MFSDEIRIKLENIVNGIVIEEQGNTCTTVRNLLCTSFRTSTTVKKDFEGKSIIKEKQVEFLKQLANKHNWWVKDLPDRDKYLAEGGEAMVYLHSDNKSVYIYMKPSVITEGFSAPQWIYIEPVYGGFELNL